MSADMDAAGLLRQQESLRQVIESISSELALQPLLTRIIRHACELLNADHGTIGLVDAARGVVRTEATYRMPGPEEAGAEFAPGMGLAGQVYLTGEPVVLDRYGDLSSPSRTDLLDQAVLGVPVFWRDRLIGFFGLGSPPPRRFSQRDVEVLSLFAKHAAIAIENARLFERSQQMAVIEERNRLARELHDSVTQRLFSISLIAQSVAPAWRRDPAEGETRVDRLLDLTRQALAEMRALLVELRPNSEAGARGRAACAPPDIALLRRAGLAAALEQHVQALREDNCAIDLDAGDAAKLDGARGEALYRIAQEALGNALKHAKASHVAVAVRIDDDGARLTIRDDGRGFDTRRPRTRGLGLTTMSERAHGLGGSLRVCSQRGHGTLVEAWLPACCGEGGM